MDARQLFIVFCESEAGVTFVQYVRADSPEKAETLGSGPGYKTSGVEPVANPDDWLLDAVNRTQRGFAAAHHEVRLVRGSGILQHPLRYVVGGVVLAQIAWALVSALLVAAVALLHR